MSFKYNMFTGNLEFEEPDSGSGSEPIPDNALLHFNATTNEYYLITMAGDVLTWST